MKLIPCNRYEVCVTCLLFLMVIYLLLSVFQSHSPLKKNSNLPQKYILSWSDVPYLRGVYEEYPPHKQKCKFTNCILTNNKYYFFGGYKHFDAIIFKMTAKPLPTPIRILDTPGYRNKSQVYIFFTIESPFMWPACELYLDGFFNWTFTSRLDSDVVWKYFVVLNNSGHEVAPSLNVNWQISDEPISPRIKVNWAHRTKAAAWLVSNCEADNFRHFYVTKLQESLYQFSLHIDVFGSCSGIYCPNDDCDSMLAKDYHFYLAFENSFSDDYVTEKVLHGYNNYVVPIVYGSSNYSRFLPPGSYINAHDYHPYHLAVLMKEAISDLTKYEKYFTWTNSYTIVESTPKYNPMCSLCEALNSDKVKHPQVYNNLRLWFNTPRGMKWCLSDEYFNETSIENADVKHLFKLY